MRRLTVRLTDAAGAVGWPHLALLASRWLLRQEFLVLLRDLTGDLPPLPPVPGLRWTELAEGDIDAVVALDPSLSHGEVRRRQAAGEECRLGWIGGTLACLRWDAFAPTWLPYLGLTLRLERDDVLLGHSYTRPAFRGRGLHTAGHMEAMHRARERGRSRSITLVAAWNRPALRVSRDRAGGVVVGTAGIRNLLLTRRHFATGSVSIGPDRTLHSPRGS